jgi:transposase
MYTVIDAAGNELDLEDHQPCPPGCSLQIPLQFLDAQQRAVRNAWHDAEPEKHSTYVLRDNAGRPAGVASVAGALAVQDAFERMCTRLYKRKAAARQMRDGKPNARNWYTDWLNAHGHDNLAFQ